MGWIKNKLDLLTVTVISVIAGLTSLQLPAFINAYMQRLGGHLDEARLSLVTIKTAKGGKIAEETGLRERLTATAQERVDNLEAAQSTISQAGSFEKPFAFFVRLDGDIAQATAEAFTPALPLDIPSLIFAVIGIVVGLLIWGGIKAPARLYRRKRRGIQQA